MLKKMVLVVLICFLGVSVSFAAQGTLNVDSDDANTELYLDGKLIGKGSVSMKVEAGTHILKAVLGGKVIYNEIVKVEADQANAVRIAKYLEKEALRVHTLGFGYTVNFASSSGIMFKWFPSNFGLAAVYGSYDAKILEGSNYIDKHIDSYGLKLLYLLKDTKWSNFYVGIGSGIYGDAWDDTFLFFPTDIYKTDYSEVFFGFDFANEAFNIPELAASIEMGYRWARRNAKTGDKSEKAGMSFGIGMIYYVQ